VARGVVRGSHRPRPARRAVAAGGPGSCRLRGHGCGASSSREARAADGAVPPFPPLIQLGGAPRGQPERFDTDSCIRPVWAGYLRGVSRTVSPRRRRARGVTCATVVLPHAIPQLLTVCADCVK
jgi:hypothetical protein